MEEAVRTHERVVITRNDTRAAVLMSADDYDVLLETLDILSDADLVRELNEAAAESALGESHRLGAHSSTNFPRLWPSPAQSSSAAR